MGNPGKESPSTVPLLSRPPPSPGGQGRTQLLSPPRAPFPSSPTCGYMVALVSSPSSAGLSAVFTLLSGTPHWAFLQSWDLTCSGVTKKVMLITEWASASVRKALGESACSCVSLFVTPWTVAHQAPLSMGFSRQEYWSGLPLPSLIYATEKPNYHST